MSSTPSPPMILVTTHKSPDVFAYDLKNGKQLDPKSVLKKDGIDLEEPRGIYLGPGGGLLVIDGSKTSSNVYLYPRPTEAGEKYGPGSILIGSDSVNSIDHPFALAFQLLPDDASATAWVSNQDSNVVASFHLSLTLPPSAAPNAPAPYLAKFGQPDQFLQATWVASAVGNLPGVPLNPPLVPLDQGGLWASFGTGKDQDKVKHSVRDVAIVGDVLLVVDEASGVVRLYQGTTGDYYGASTLGGDATATLDSPTHLLVSESTIYVSTTTAIYSGPLTGSPPTLDFAKVFDAPGKSISGMAMDSAGNFYFADRVKQSLYAYSPGFAKQLWEEKGLSDQPEFLLLIEG